MQNKVCGKKQNKHKKGGTLLSGMLNNLVVRVSALKRMSAHSPGRRLRASMTVEACFVLPFFLFAFLNVISIVELYRLQGNMRQQNKWQYMATNIRSWKGNRC